ncbi:MAG: response regulator [Desulfomonilaceae bacterium]
MPFRIVVADKDPQTAADLTHIVADRDIECLHVETAAELKQAIKSQNPSLIMLAPVLKDTPHWRAAHKIVSAIKTSRDYAQTPVVVLTGYPNGPSESQLHTLGADAYLSTPLDSAETLRLLESFSGASAAPSTQIDDDDIIIDFDDDEEEIESYVEDKPVELTSHSEGALQMDEAVESGDELAASPEPELGEELKLGSEDQEFTDLPFQMDAGGEEVETLDTFEQGSLEYADIPRASPEQPLELIQEPLDVVDAGKPAEESPDLLGDFTPELAEPPEPEHSVLFYRPAAPQDMPEERIEDKEVLLSTLQSILPDKDAILHRLTQTIADALPRREELLTLVSQRIDASLPSREDLIKAVAERVPPSLQVGVSQSEPIPATCSSESCSELIHPRPKEPPAPIPRTSEEGRTKTSLETPKASASDLTVDGLVRNIIHERIDQIMPDRDQILQWIRNEIEARILDTVERIIRQKVEEITADTASDGV